MTDEVAGGATSTPRGDLVDGAPVAMLRLIEIADIDPDRVPAVLGQAEAPWLGEATSPRTPAERSYLCDLELRAGTNERVLFRKAAVVSLSAPAATESGWIVPIEWRAATMNMLFPVLHGYLRVAPNWITLEGHYAPPGGRLGYLLDNALLGIAARQTGRWFLRHVAQALHSA
jgi:hypothetical protein